MEAGAQTKGGSVTSADWARLAELVEESAGLPEVLARLLRLEATAEAEPGDVEQPDLPRRRKGAKQPYPIAFETLWRALGHLGGIGNSIKSEAYTAWIGVGRPMDNVACRWGEYLASLPEYQTTPRHVGRWLKARGHDQTYLPYQPLKSSPGVTGAATKPIEAPRCPPHRDRVIPPTKMGERWAAPGVPCVACKELSAKWGDRHVDENDLFGRVAK